VLIGLKDDLKKLVHSLIQKEVKNGRKSQGAQCYELAQEYISMLKEIFQKKNKFKFVSELTELQQKICNSMMEDT